MGRLARVATPGLPHHVTQRGNGRARVFCADEERHRYLKLVQHFRLRYGLQMAAYCLMDKHVHWVVVPEREKALAETFRDAHANFADLVNCARQRPGHLFQGRFFSCPLGDEHFWTAVRYVERNPVRAGMVARAEDCAWSSAAAHCGFWEDPLLSPGFPPTGVVSDWREWLATENGQQTQALRRQTLTGRPCGSLAFLLELEARIGRVLRPLKRGRRSRVAVMGQGELFR